MPDPLAPLLVPNTYQDTDPHIIETTNVPVSTAFRLGSTLARPYPLSTNLIPKGASPVPTPGAPTAGAGLGTGDLATNGHYSWACTFVTQWGETVAGSLLTITGIGVGNTGQTLNLPALASRPDNPILAFRLYRTVNSGVNLFLVAEIDDLTASSYVDETSDTELITPPPVSDTSGSIGAVDVYDGSIHWTEVPLGTTLTTKHFSVDYTVTATGGTVHFASADVGLAITITYFAGTFLGSGFLNLYQAAHQAIYDFCRTNATAEFSHGVLIDQGLEVLGATDLDGALDVAGASTLTSLTTSSLHTTGTSALDGVVTAGNNLHVVGNTQLDGTLDVTGATVLHSTLSVTGATTLSSTLHVVGSSTFDSSVTLSGASSLTVGGSISASGTISSSSLSSSTFAGDISCPGITVGVHGITNNGPANFNNGLNVASGNVAIPGNIITTIHGTSSLQIDGTSTLVGSVFAQNELTVYNTLHLKRIAIDTVNGTAAALSSGSVTLPGGHHAGTGATVSFGATSYDTAGQVHLHTGTGASQGLQFRVTYDGSGGHSTQPLVFLTGLDNRLVYGPWTVSNSNGSFFEVATSGWSPEDGVDYHIQYIVVDIT